MRSLVLLFQLNVYKQKTILWNFLLGGCFCIQSCMRGQRVKNGFFLVVNIYEVKHRVLCLYLKNSNFCQQREPQWEVFRQLFSMDVTYFQKLTNELFANIPMSVPSVVIEGGYIIWTNNLQIFWWEIFVCNITHDNNRREGGNTSQMKCWFPLKILHCIRKEISG